MKIRRRKKKRQQPLVWFFLFCLLSVGGRRGRSQWSLAQLRKEFVFQVTPLQEKMRTFPELDLSFLSGDSAALPREMVVDPEGYIRTLKESFRYAIELYNINASTPLVVEIDGGTMLPTLSLEQKVAQLFVVGFEGTELSDETLLFLESQQPGGVILMGRNISEELSGLISTLQAQSNQLPFFVAIDQEGGQVSRIDENLPTQADITREEVCPTYLERSELLHKQGINLNFGIVADVSATADAFIYPRVFRDDVDKKIIDAVQCTTETLSTLKHFPGHGMTTEDTHLGTAEVKVTREQREKKHLSPFVAGIDAGVDVVMMAHILVPRIDTQYPVSLSVSGVSLLRDQGFDGLVITDDLGMLRSDYSEKEAIKNALIAGNDVLLLVNPSDSRELITSTVDLVRSGLISQQDLDARLGRIIRAKNKIIKRGRYVPLELMR